MSLSQVSLPATGPVTVVIGPEGGIDPEELAELDALGSIRVSLGPHVLRASTAGAVALTQLQLLVQQAEEEPDE